MISIAPLAAAGGFPGSAAAGAVTATAPSPWSTGVGVATGVAVGAGIGGAALAQCSATTVYIAGRRNRQAARSKPTSMSPIEVRCA